METVLVEYNPRNTKHLRIIQMLEAFGLIKKNPNKEITLREYNIETKKALNDAVSGKVVKCKNTKDLIEKLNS